ncbi:MULTISPECIES: glycosyltransferase family 2 protein [Methanocalculus]|uniref:glycosyltransferase family 2 protein n=1 Tax=Methanocalculus TaxID=71151 RepID=UPI0020A1C58C|nr:glycosyltransferase family 2 protein [Methanocalculus sp. AMF5]MCP1663181.1 glycosyltransferase involved in cell wall biosynthesis [Methanocalculus sp. AMF5]
MPTLNEEKTIRSCIEKIHQAFEELGMVGEIIIADSSTDRTSEIARSLGAIVVHPDYLGYGNAYLAGLASARGRYIAIGDADDTYDFRDLPKLVRRIDEGYDFVLGSRLKGEIRPGAMPRLHQYIGNPFLTWLLNKLFNTDISDAHSGFRVIQRDALEQLDLRTGGMEFASEMFIEAAKKGLCIGEVPITYWPRVAPSKLNSFRDGWRHIRFMLLYRPIPFIAVPGLVFTFFGLFMMLFFYLQGDIETSSMHSFILAALAFIGGLQALLMGVMIKVYSVIHGYSDKSRFIGQFMHYYNLERELILGLLLICGGVAIGLGIIYEWVAGGFGDLYQITNAVWSLTLFLSGMQIVFSAIIISMMLVNQKSDEVE